MKLKKKKIIKIIILEIKRINKEKENKEINDKIYLNI